MKIIYISHPVGGNVLQNTNKILGIISKINVIEPDVVPFAHYLVDIQAMDDDVPEERAKGIRNNTELLSRKFIDELRLYGDYISAGMKWEIELAINLMIPIKPMTEGTKKDFEKYFK